MLFCMHTKTTARLFSVRKVVAILRAAGVQLQDARGSRRQQRAGLHVSQWQGSEHRGAATVIVSLIKLDYAQAKTWFDAAKIALAAQGASLEEPNGPEALCCIITN